MKKMNAKYVTAGGIALAVIIIAVAVAVNMSTGSPAQPQQLPPPQQTSGSDTGSQGNGSPAQLQTPPAGQTSVAPVNANVGSVSGVDLSVFGTQANDSSAVVSQDGTTSVQSLAGDGQAINTSTDSVTNPIK